MNFVVFVSTSISAKLVIANPTHGKALLGV